MKRQQLGVAALAVLLSAAPNACTIDISAPDSGQTCPEGQRHNIDPQKVSDKECYTPADN